MVRSVVDLCGSSLGGVVGRPALVRRVEPISGTARVACNAEFLLWLAATNWESLVS